MTFLIAKDQNLKDKIKDAEVIYLPEEHINQKDHEHQLKVIRFMHSEGVKFVIAMEMFQQSFQRYLDDYVASKITEEEMIEKTEYKKRWGYDPSLYSPIWRFAKEKGIRIYAINAPSELLREIRQKGLKNVEDPILPNPIVEQTEEEIKDLMEVLRHHPKTDTKSFFEIQNTWDNVMAYAIVRILQENPDKKVVVLAGKGHIGSMHKGIPYRVSTLRPNTKQVILTPP